MSAKSPVLAILQVSDNDRADDTLVEGLAKAEPSYQGALVDVLLTRKSATGLLGIVAHFHDLDAKIQSEVLNRADALFSVLRRAVKARDLQTRRNALELISRIGNYRLAYLLCLTLRDRASGIRQRSAEILRELVDRYFRQQHVTLEVLSQSKEVGPDQISVQAYSLARLAEERSYLIATISEAVNDFEVHRRPEVAETMMWLAPHLSETLRRAVSDRRSGCGRAVTRLAQSSTDPRIVPFVYEALSHRDLRPPIVHVLSKRRDEAFMHALMRDAYLVADARIRRGLSAIRHLDWLTRGGQPLLALDPKHYARAVDFVLATSIPIERKMVILKDLLLSGERPAQRAALWGLIQIDDDMSTQLIRTVIQWRDTDLSAIALREMMRRQPKNLPTFLAPTAARGSPAIRSMADEQIRSYGFDEYWQSFDVLDEEDRRRIGKALLESGKSFLPSLRSRLVSQQSSERLRAIQIIGTLQIIKELREEIYRAAHDSNAFVRSAVMTLLGQLRGATSERILLNGLNDADERVQANSIESLEQLRAVGRLEQIRECLSSQDSRVRGNAVKALLTVQSREAGAVLLEMLGHVLPAQRASALWVIETLGLMTLAGRVLRLAKHDPDPNVRRRALLAATALNNALQEAPVEAATPVEAPQEAVS